MPSVDRERGEDPAQVADLITRLRGARNPTSGSLDDRIEAERAPGGGEEVLKAGLAAAPHLERRCMEAPGLQRQWYRPRREQPPVRVQPRSRSILLEDDECSSVRHAAGRTASEVAVLRGQLKARGVEGRVGPGPPVDPSVPPPREVDLDPVGGEPHPATATMASPASASWAASADQRTGPCSVRIRA